MRSPERRLEILEHRMSLPPTVPTAPPVLPNIIDFVVGERYLDRPQLYPRQATLLKLIFLQTELLTDYDCDVIDEWESAIEDDASGLINGYGIPRGILRRVEQCRASGRLWFSEVVAVMGRRGSKGYLGALATSYVLATFLCTGDPQEHYGLARDKSLFLPIFAGNKEQARDNFWQDLRNVIVGSPFFAPYLAEVRADRMFLWSHDQISRKRGPNERPTFHIAARESTENAARGYTTVGHVFDEMAHARAGGANRSADDLYRASKPALLQFGENSFSYLASSPHTRVGQFYRSFTEVLEVDSSGEPVNPHALGYQFPSWELYRDWERAHELERYPGGPPLSRIRRPILNENDPDLQRLRLSNPEMFLVEILGQWAEVDCPFLARVKVDPMFGPWNGEVLEMAERGTPRYKYVAHLDLSLTGDNTALVVGHAVPGEDPGRPDFVLDLIIEWKPDDFTDGHVDYRIVEPEAKAIMDLFKPVRFTVDQWNGRSIVENLKDHAYTQRYRTTVDSIDTNQIRNRKLAENFKVALYEGRVHSPPHAPARDELLYLRDDGNRVDHPSTGPVTTNDIATCIFEVVWMLSDLAFDPGRQLSALRLRGRPFPHYGSDDEVFQALSRFGRGFPGR